MSFGYLDRKMSYFGDNDNNEDVWAKTGILLSCEKILRNIELKIYRRLILSLWDSSITLAFCKR